MSRGVSQRDGTFYSSRLVLVEAARTLRAGFFFLISAAFCYAESSYPLFQFLGVFGCSHECQVSCWHHIHMDMNQFMYSKSERPVVTFSGGDSGFPLWTVNVRAHFSSTFSIS